MVQYTYHITTNYTQSYTINVYLTKCSHLINGKNTQGLIDRDIPLIHYIISNTQGLIDRDIPLIHCIISNTKINGVSLNIEQLNQSLKLKLEKALSALSKPETSMNCSDSNKIYKKYKEEKCYKCKSNCKSRAALCLNGHWIHYMCDRLYNGR